MKHFWIAISFFLLTACGGGGGGEKNNDTPPITPTSSSLQIASTSSLISSASSTASLSQQSSGSSQSSSSSSHTLSTSSSINSSAISSASSNNGFVFFQDANVKETVRNKLSLSPDSDITPLQMESLTQLTLENPTSLIGLETAINLESLFIRNTTDADLSLELSPIGSLIKINKLGLGNFNLGNLASLQNLTTITELNLSESRFSNLNVLGSFIQLTKLFLTDTNISSLPSSFSNLTNLYTLYMNDNPLTDAGITSIHALPIKELNISYTEITDLSFLSTKSELTGLYISGAPVYDLSPLLTTGWSANGFFLALNTCVHYGKYALNPGYITALKNRGVTVIDSFQSAGMYGGSGDKVCPNQLHNSQIASTALYSQSNLQLNWSISDAGDKPLVCEIYGDLQGQQSRTPLTVIENCHIINQTNLSTVFVNSPIYIKLWNGFGSSKVFSSSIVESVEANPYLHSYDWGQTIVKYDSKLIPNKNALLRLHILNKTSIAAPNIQVIASLNSIDTALTIQKPVQLSSTKDFNSLTKSYNVTIDKSLMQPGLEIKVTVGGNEKTIKPVFGVANKLNLTLIPIKISTTTGIIPDHTAIRNAFLEWWPFSEINLKNRAAFTSSAVTAADIRGVLYEIDELQFLDGDESHYYGFFSDAIYDLLNFNEFGGIAFVEDTTGIGTDRDPTFYTMLHELGHNFSLNHINCGNPAGPDLRFPYDTNSIGSLGINLDFTQLFIANQYRDIMSYCSPNFVSDYSYEKVQDYLEENPSKAFKVANSQKMSAIAEQYWFISGVINSNNEVQLRRLLPTNRQISQQNTGRYQLQITDTQGIIYTQYFDAKELDHQTGKTEKFFSLLMPYADINKLEIYQGTAKLFSQVESTIPTSTTNQLQKTATTIRPLVTQSHQQACLDWDESHYDTATLIAHQNEFQSTLFMDTKDKHYCVDFDHQGKGIQWQILLRKNLRVDEFWQND